MIKPKHILILCGTLAALYGALYPTLGFSDTPGTQAACGMVFLAGLWLLWDYWRHP